MTLSDMFNDSEAKEIKNYCNAVFDGLRKAKAKERVQSPHMDGRQINLQGLAAEIWFKKKHKIGLRRNIKFHMIYPSLMINQGHI
jgi:hypothetical protein